MSSSASPYVFELEVKISLQGTQILLEYYLPLVSSRFNFIFIPKKNTFLDLHNSINTGDPEPFQDNGEIGSKLFSFLFGNGLKIEEVLRVVHGDLIENQTPVSKPISLKIISDLPEYIALPWRLMRWKNFSLVKEGWQITTAFDRDITQTESKTIQPRSGLLAIFTGTKSASHSAQFTGALKEVWGDKEESWLSIALSKNDIRQALEDKPPTIIYIDTQQNDSDNRDILLRNSDGSEYPWSAFQTDIEKLKHPPAVIYMNSSGALPLNLDPSKEFSKRTPFVVRNIISTEDDAKNNIALSFFHNWLHNTKSPITAFHESCKSYPSTTADSLVCLSHRIIFQTFPYIPPESSRVPGQQQVPIKLEMILDRDGIKSHMLKWISELLGDSRARVMALLPFAAPDNMIEILSDQLIHFLNTSEVLANSIAIKKINVDFPDIRINLIPDLEQALRRALGAESNEPWDSILTRAAPEAPPGRQRIIWLDMGAFGHNNPQLKHQIKADEISDWLSHAHNTLTPFCPRSVKVICFASMEVAPKHISNVDSFLEKLDDNFTDPAFWYKKLSSPVGKVPKRELLDFLRHISCPANILTETRDLLYQKSNGGVFQQLIVLLNKGVNSGWYALRSHMKGELEPNRPKRGTW
ncbi:MAG: hypothetical protein HQL54_10685 [Magnetococcales bacterium]|nr:hypothetical protein [Magnetococcales bacterium]